MVASFNNCRLCAGHCSVAGKGRVASHWSVTAGHCSLAGSKVILVAGQSLFTRTDAA